jgi:type I restriction enzyme S subunit
MRGENVGSGIPNWKDTQHLRADIAAKFGEYRLHPGDIIIGMDRTFTKNGFKVSVVSCEDTPSLLVQRVGRFLAKSIPPGFMQLLVQSPRYQRELLRQQKGMDIPHLAKSEILAPLAAVPARYDEMESIWSRIEIFNAVERKNQCLVRKMRSLKSGLMEELLAGRKRVTSLMEDGTIAAA